MQRRRTPTSRALTAFTVAVCTVVPFLLPAGPAAATAGERPSFYEPPASLPAGNGDVIRSEPAAFTLDPLKAVRVNADVRRIMYRSTDRLGRAIAVTGTVLTPRSAYAGARPLVAFAPGTQGLADACAPSRQMAAGTEYEALPVKTLLDRGWQVVVTDYQGLGTPGVHTYMNRVVQGHAVLDSLRAAKRLTGADPAAGPVALYGYSQGGGAAASAAELAAGYAPELRIAGAVVGAPPADMTKMADTLDGSPYSAFLDYAFSGLAAGYGIDPGPYLSAHGRTVTSDLRDHRCTTQALVKYAFMKSSSLTADGRPLTALLRRAPWNAIMAEQRLGRLRPAAPVLVSHSVLDDVIPQQVGKDLAADWCRLGATVKFAGNLVPTHVAAAAATSTEGVRWLTDRFAGRPAPDTC